MSIKARLAKLEAVEAKDPPIKIVIIQNEDDRQRAKDLSSRGYRVIIIQREEP